MAVPVTLGKTVEYIWTFDRGGDGLLVDLYNVEAWKKLLRGRETTEVGLL